MKSHQDDPKHANNSENDSRREAGEERGRERGQSGQRRREGSRRPGGRRRGHPGRKEKILHTRVSEQLSDDIRRFAEDLRVPASNLVRNVLEEVFTLVDHVADDMGGLMDDVLEEAEGVRDRIRRQAQDRSARDGARPRAGRASRSGNFDADVEAELREDEAKESGRADRRRARSRPEPEQEAAGSRPERGTPADLFPDILGWQPLVLNRAADCGRCEASLAAGESAFLGVGAAGLTTTTLCGPCAGGRQS